MATKGSTDVMATSLAHRVGSLERVGRTAFTAPGAKNPPGLRGVFLERRGLSERSEFRSLGRNTPCASSAASAPDEFGSQPGIQAGAPSGR